MEWLYSVGAMIAPRRIGNSGVMRASLLVCLLVVSSCGVERESALRGSCGCIDLDEPWTDEATLKPHVDEGSYLGSVISFQYATTVDHGEVHNDWDLSLTPSTTEPDALTFRVNLATDDRSCIEDLGAVAISSVPANLTRCDDHVPVVLGHVYLVENRDPDQQQFAAFAVTALDGAHSASLRWYRSSQPDRFSFEH